jgi:hypothetical protein
VSAVLRHDAASSREEKGLTVLCHDAAVFPNLDRQGLTVLRHDAAVSREERPMFSTLVARVPAL